MFPTTSKLRLKSSNFVMAENKLRQDVAFIAAIVLIILRTCSTHNCKDYSEQKERIAASDNIFKVNQKYGKYSNNREYQLDMKLPKSRSNAGASDKEAAVRDKTKLWPEGIVPYIVSYNLRNRETNMKNLKAAMKEWEQQTCIRFIKAGREENYIEFERGEGCSSDVGMQGGRQSVSLGDGCFRHGTILHELGHLLGFFHEQNRPDRDDYVEILEQNIKPKFKYAFKKNNWRTVDTRSVPYDYHSVMHYGSKDFTRNNKITIRSLDPKIKEFGNDHLSPLDVKQANLMYRCNAKTPNFPDDFTWSHNGRISEEECTRIFEPKEHHRRGWTDNFLCQHKGKNKVGFRWSASGPLDDMRCVKIDMPSKPARYSWNDNYLCLPHANVYKLQWSTNGPLTNKSCLKITEPRDWFWRRANAYLCAEKTSIDGGWSEWDPWKKCDRECGSGRQSRRRSCTKPPPSNGGKYCEGKSSEQRTCNTHPCSAWPVFPDDFIFGTSFVPPGARCIRIYERFEFSFSGYPYFCSDGGMRAIDMRWSDAGPLTGMRCTRIYKPRKFGWNDNYLCIGKEAPYRFKWSYGGTIDDLPCMKWESKRSRSDNYLCVENPRAESGVKERSHKVDGRWSPWKPWSACSKSCKTGWQNRTRTCSNPAPSNGGKHCEGKTIEVRFCNKHSCPFVCGGSKTGNSGQIKSPSYPARYPRDSDCTWTITVPRGKVVKLTFNVFKLQEGRKGCDTDKVTVRDGTSDRSRILGTFCGAQSKPNILVSSSNTMKVRFFSDAYGSYRGFEASWKAQTRSGDPQTKPPVVKECGGQLKGNSGEFKGLVPPGKTSCNWFITADKNRVLTVTYEAFDVTKTTRCRFNYVELREYKTRRGVSHGRQCGTKKDVRTMFETKANKVRIRMRSTRAPKGRGVTVRWTSRRRDTVSYRPQG